VVAAEIGVSLRRIAVLLLLVLGLGAYLWFYERPRAEQEAAKSKLLTVDKDKITGLDLVYPDREIVLRKDGKTWRLTKPINAPADDGIVSAMVASLADAEVSKTIDEMPADLAAFGLDKPTVTATFTEGTTALPPLVVGKNTAIGGKTYVRRGTEAKLLMIPSTLAYALNKQVKDLRDKQVLVFQDDAVARVDLLHADGRKVSLIRSDKDKDAWTVDPGGYKADPTEVRSYLSQLRTARAVDFAPDLGGNLAPYGLDAPRLSVTIVAGKDGADSQTLLFGKDTTQGSQTEVYAQRAAAPTVYLLGDFTFRALDKDASAFRDKSVLGFDAARVGKVTITRKDGSTVTVTRAGTGPWVIDGEQAGTTKGEAVSRFLDDLRDLRGSGIAAEPPGDLKRFGLDAPDTSIVLTDVDGGAIATILLAKHDGKFYAMTANGPAVFEVRDYMFSRLDKQKADFQPGATPPPPPPGAAAMPDEDPGEDEEPLE
jgi:hypothetical protein